jgi:hypothetical protein
LERGFYLPLYFLFRIESYPEFEYLHPYKTLRTTPAIVKRGQAVLFTYWTLDSIDRMNTN